MWLLIDLQVAREQRQADICREETPFLLSFLSVLGLLRVFIWLQEIAALPFRKAVKPVSVSSQANCSYISVVLQKGLFSLWKRDVCRQHCSRSSWRNATMQKEKKLEDSSWRMQSCTAHGHPEVTPPSRDRDGGKGKREDDVKGDK